MNATRFGVTKVFVALSLLTTTALRAQVPPPPVPANTRPEILGAIKDSTVTPVSSQTGTAMMKDTTALSTAGTSSTASTDSLPDRHLDNAVAALAKGDKATTTGELQAGIAGLEAEVQRKPSSFRTKILNQVGNLKRLLPLIAGGGLGGNVLQKAVGLTKLASGAGRLDNLLSAGSLIGKAGQLTSGLSGLGSAMSVLGGGTRSTGQSLLSTALASVGKLNQGGAVAAAAEPAVKSQVGSLLNFVKGAL